MPTLYRKANRASATSNCEQTMRDSELFKTIEVSRTIPAPIQNVFDVLSDHAGYAAFSGIKGARLLKPGADNVNGLGAVRRIDLGGVWFEEEITVFDPPCRMDYRILRSRPPIEHENGSIRLEETEHGTRVTWTSKFRIRLPLIGRWMTGPAANAGEKAFSGMLKAIEKPPAG